MNPDLFCVVCRSTLRDCPVEVRTDTGYDLVRCPTCGVLVTDIRYAPAAASLYPAFDQSGSGIGVTSRSAAGRFLTKRVRVTRAAAATGRCLDFGAGNGAFARAMADAGFEVVGLEPFSMGVTERTHNLTLIRSSLHDALPQIGQFDVVTMWHVFEHLDNPLETLHELTTVMRPGAALVISVPNEASWQRRMFRKSWFHLDPPRHVAHFDDRTLAETLARAGFAVTASIPFLPEYGTSGWVQSVLNRALPRRNFLYELVKDRGALENMSRASFALHLVTSMAIGGPLLLLAVPVEWLASRRNAAAACTVVARRT